MSVIIKETKEMGRGVFAKKTFRMHDPIIEKDHVLVFDKTDTTKIQKTIAGLYIFSWSESSDGEETAISLGKSSLINHSNDPNCEVHINLAEKTLDVVAIKKIKKGQQIYFNYGYNPKTELIKLRAYKNSIQKRKHK